MTFWKKPGGPVLDVSPGSQYSMVGTGTGTGWWGTWGIWWWW